MWANSADQVHKIYIVATGNLNNLSECAILLLSNFLSQALSKQFLEEPQECTKTILGKAIS